MRTDLALVVVGFLAGAALASGSGLLMIAAAVVAFIVAVL